MLFYNDVKFYLFFSIAEIDGGTVGIVSSGKIGTGISGDVVGLDTANIPIPNLGGGGIIDIPALDLGELLGMLKISKFTDR